MRTLLRQKDKFKTERERERERQDLSLDKEDIYLNEIVDLKIAS
jgi:hypothetical protein